MSAPRQGTPSADIATVDALEACIGKTPGPMHLKVIDHLDVGVVGWLAASPFLFATFADAASIGISLAGGRAGFVDVIDTTRLSIRKEFLDRPELASEGCGFGGLFLIPGIGETLRVNGRVHAIDQAAIQITVEECYIHCAKALIRSDFWDANPQSAIPTDIAEFLKASRFLALATVDGGGYADVSPKGDPVGMMIRLTDDAAWFADRPGNRRADSFRNILTQPRIVIAALVPGATRIALLQGEAQLRQDEQARAGFAVQNKAPLIVTRIERPEILPVDSPALARARLWPAKPPTEAIDPAAIISGHVKLSKERGLQATLVRAALSVPGLVQKGLKHDYKTNLY